MHLSQKRRGLFAYILIIILSVFISGCVSLPDPEVSQDSHSDVIGIVNPTQAVSQTFTLRRNGFNGITIWLGVEAPDSINDEQFEQLLHVDLYSHSIPLSLIHHTTIQLDRSTQNQAFTISFPPQSESSGGSYSLQLSANTGAVDVYGRLENSYALGQYFVDLQPYEADIGFTTTYNYDSIALLTDIKDWVKSTYLIPPFLIVLFLPGWLLLKTSFTQPSFDFGQRIGLSLGISLAILPVILLWTSTLGISWTKITVLFLSGFLVSIWIFLMIRKRDINIGISETRRWTTNKLKEPFLRVNTILRQDPRRLAILAILLSIFLFSLAVRLIMVRDIATPAWVDSVHHALITRIIIETGSLPSNYLPYLDLEYTYYHPGFHSQLATFKLLSDLDIPTSMLIFGQILNALMVIPVYTFTKSLTNSSITALFAAFITGLFTPMPAYYTSWGRYTQLSGLIILPTAYILFKHATIPNKKVKDLNSSMVVSAITAGGLFLVHYRVTAFFILLVASDLLINFVVSIPNKFSIKRQFLQLVVYSILAALLILPWIIQATPDTFIPSLARPVAVETRWFADFSWRYLSAALGKQALAIGGLGAIWGMIQKKKFALLLLTWIGFLLLFANLGVIGLPGSGLINTTSVEISLFIPISIFGGYFISEIIKLWKSVIPHQLNLPLNAVLFASTGVIAIVAARNLVPILNPVTFLSRQADLTAEFWIEENIDDDKSILINPFLWGYGLYAGNDGGSWITPLAGNKTIPPPVLYALAREEDIEYVNQISQFVIDNGDNAVELYNYLKEKNINYIYAGARGGPISPLALTNHPGFRLIYESQGVWIFEILP